MNYQRRPTITAKLTSVLATRTARLVRSRALGGIVLGLAGFFASSMPAMGAPVPWLYDVDVAVEGRTTAAMEAVSGDALLGVLSRVSGLSHVPRNDRVREALGRPEAYFNRFVFLDDGVLRIHFTPGAILNLLDEARLPVWSANRPRAMAWLVVEAGSVRQIVDGEHPLAASFARRARQRGLVVKLPLMDLEDRMLVRPAIVLGRLYASLDEASKRYGAEVVLAGNVSEKPCEIEWPAETNSDIAVHPASADDDTRIASSATATGPGRQANIDSRWPPADERALDATSAPPDESEQALLGLSSDASPSAPESIGDGASSSRDLGRVCGPGAGVFYSVSLYAWMEGEEFATEFAATDIETAGWMTVDFIADELAARFAVLAREPTALSLVVRGIDTPVGYGRLLRYLDDLEFINAVDVAGVQTNRLELTLHTRAGLEQLVELLERDGRLRSDPADPAALIWRGP